MNRKYLNMLLLICCILFIAVSSVAFSEESNEKFVLTLPAALTDVGEEAFAGTPAVRIVLPEGCISIGSRAFADCENLEYIVIPESVAHIAKDAFEGSKNLCILCKPGSTAAFCAEMAGIPWQDISQGEDVPVASITLNKKEISVAAGENTALTAQVLPEDASNPQLEWTSSDASVASVNDGVVQGKMPGIAMITASAQDGSDVSASCMVRVTAKGNKVAFSDMKAGASSSNVYLHVKATSSVSGKYTAMGVRIWKKDGTLAADYEKTISTSARTSQTVWFDVFGDSGISLAANTDYICQMHVVFAGNTSWTDFASFRTGTGFSADSGLDSKTMVNNLKNCSDTSVLSSSKKSAMVTMADALLGEGYDPAFVSGVLANIYYEGTFGKFESSKYSSNEPAYLVYMDENYDYRNKYSNKLIYNGISLSDVSDMLDELAAAGYPGKFGLGSVQWTGGRTKKLVDLYVQAAGASDTITLEQVIASEVKMIKNELAGSYKSIYSKWTTAYAADAYTDDAAFSAGYRVCVSYEVPASYRLKAIERGQKAMAVYRVMMGL